MYLIQNENGTWREKKKPYVTIECETKEDFEFIQRAVEEKNARGWIPVEESIPKGDSYILLSFKNFPIPQIGRYEEDKYGGAFYVGDDEESCISQNFIVNAWQPLPEPYRS